MHLTTFLGVLLSSSAFVLVQSACSGPEVTVNLRVEGFWETFYEGPVTTCGHDVTTPSGGTHRCDGTNNDAQFSPGPTVTSALDTAAALWNFTWDGTFDKKIDDFNVTAVNGHQHVWTPFVNWGFVSINGCQVPVKAGDDVLWLQLRLGLGLVLKLDGPKTVTANEPFQLTVMDAFRRLPVEGATIRHLGTSDKDGHITVTLADQGIYKLKAEKEDAVRSNGVWIQVLPQEDEPLDKPQDDKPQEAEKPQEDKPQEAEKPQEDKPQEAEKPQEDKPKAEKPKKEPAEIDIEGAVEQEPVVEHIKEEL